jgi:DNA-binding NarL/FixJ family response regulator
MRRPLTAREMKGAELIAGGLTNRQIAQTLDTAYSTMKNQVSSILTKLDFLNRVEVAVWFANQKHELQEA